MDTGSSATCNLLCFDFSVGANFWIVDATLECALSVWRIWRRFLMHAFVVRACL